MFRILKKIVCWNTKKKEKKQLSNALNVENNLMVDLVERSSKVERQEH